ncbi:hypothetical protein K7Y63_004167 [Serratia marcescens]|uniref:hypothetical protein n=1 Tax=Serratia sp. CC22-02 TaxID=1378076 RepID=UPI0024B660A8|nr:hypothetical protein [Serratia sp. CC22-02]
MAVKKPSDRLKQERRPAPTDADVEALAARLADRPYGQHGADTEPASVQPEQMTRTAISLPMSLQRKVEDLALANKRAGKNPKSVSAIMREAVEKYLQEVS